ncbi:hypothetical protein KDH_25590 [Dictyobacter sp. S3.2.2.5]|uniref:HTH marR-type domain-containing protein n=1 Tax=Dictyobacter halimunensis TaxID=3026934 RepID=A0ABQ6FPV6_9CHLR|nr:hypothetical protein KDH_25590 [Dictyobacter sp. S3.2.2.5]
MTEQERFLPEKINVRQADETDKERSSHSKHYLKDHVDGVLEEWAQELPDLPVAPIAIIGRLERLHTYLRSEVTAVFERFGLTGPSFAVIATLRRAGQPYQLSQRALVDALQLTGGTISVRIDRLERDGIVERQPDPSDQRGVLVRLTEKGLQLFEQVAPLHLANEERLLSALNQQERAQLADLLHILLSSFDQVTSEDPRHPLHWLGASLAPVQVARTIRRASGLPDIPGLLVRSVKSSGSTTQSKLYEGDLIIAANGLEVRTIEELYKQVLTARENPLVLDVLHGLEHRQVSLTIHLPEEG